MIVVVILGILAAIVMPQFSDAAHVAREKVLKEDLRFLRHQIAVFAIQHTDHAPGYAAGVPSAATFADQMTKFTDVQGNVSDTQDATYKFGPYLQKVPENPITGKNTIRMIADNAAMPASAAGTDGWIYQASSQTVLSDADGSDAEGKSYFSY
jgi:general secretion pathway protein G